MTTIFLIATGCDSDPNGSNYVDSPDGERLKSFVSVNLKAGLSSASRGPADDYESGSTYNENKINYARFYFFDGSGKGISVSENGSRSYIDIYPVEAGSNMNNVEKILETTLTLFPNPSADKTGAPASLIVVVNPPVNDNTLTGTGIVDRDVLIKAIAEYTPESLNPGNEGFIMSNAVYADNNGNKIVEVDLNGKVFTDLSEASRNPVDIYVERMLAKVRVELKLDDEISEGIYKLPLTKNDDNKSIKIVGQSSDQEVFIKFLGWNVTAKADKSLLIKDINPKWNENLFGNGNPKWNDSGWFRSYWAKNPEGLEYVYGDFGGDNDDETKDLERVVKIKDFTAEDGKTNYTYTFENASRNDEGKDNNVNTKIIVGAQLVNRSGEAIELAEYAYKYYTVESLKELYASQSNIWKLKTGTTNTYEKISAKDILFTTASSVEEGYDKNDGSTLVKEKMYQVYARLMEGNYYRCDIDESKGVSDSGRYSFTRIDNGNDILKNLGPAKIWRNGYTYYFLDIEHLGNRKGVVRNHLYDYQITSVIGLGVPVYDPDEVIIPEETREDETYVVADLKIMNWRLFRKQLEMNW